MKTDSTYGCGGTWRMIINVQIVAEKKMGNTDKEIQWAEEAQLGLRLPKAASSLPLTCEMKVYTATNCELSRIKTPFWHFKSIFRFKNSEAPVDGEGWEKTYPESPIDDGNT